LTALAGTALIVHALYPWLIFDIGCVLSFTVMGGLVVFCRPFCQAGQRLCHVARLTERVNLARAAGEKARARRLQMLARAVMWVSDSFAVSLAAWLASVPLTAIISGVSRRAGFLRTGGGALFVLHRGRGLSRCGGERGERVGSGCFNHAAGCFPG
jgi:hypothetical protein